MKKFWMGLALVVFAATTIQAQQTKSDQSGSGNAASHAMGSQTGSKSDAKTPDMWPHDPADAKFYRLTFVAEELEKGKVINSRKYVSSVGTWKTFNFVAASIRVGNKVPVTNGPNSFNYMDVGINFEARLEGYSGNRLFLNVTGELSDLGASTATGAAEGRPIVRQRKWGGLTVVDVGKPTVIFSSDDLTSTRTMQIEVTATPMQ